MSANGAVATTAVKPTKAVNHMELHFLGTGAGVPSRERNVTSIALRFTELEGETWLFDCGEGTQQRMLQSPIRPPKVEKVFVTHNHGDHIFGIPGFLGSRSFSAKPSDMDIFAPEGVEEFLATAARITTAHTAFAVSFHEVTPGIVYEDERVRVLALPLLHRITCFGYRIEEKTTQRQVDSERLQSAGVDPGPIYGRLQRGEDVVLESGLTLKSDEFTLPAQRGRIVAILGDTRPCENSVVLARNADVLVHEATYAQNEAEKATHHAHSTSAEAAQIALQAGVSRLILTHISARYRDDGLKRLLQDARGIFPNTELAHDLYWLIIPRHR